MRARATVLKKKCSDYRLALNEIHSKAARISITPEALKYFHTLFQQAVATPDN